VLLVLCPSGKTAALLGKFSVVRWGFHAGTTPGPDGPFRNKLSETYGTFLKGRVPATKFCNAMLELLRIENARVPEYRGLPSGPKDVSRGAHYAATDGGLCVRPSDGERSRARRRGWQRAWKHGRQQPEKGERQKPKIDDKAYNAALRNIPDRKYDAWQGVR
jgi:hypothetical protein